MAVPGTERADYIPRGLVGKDERVNGLSRELLELAQARGVATDYWDWRGNHVQVPEETIVAVLAAMDIDASSPESAAASLASETDALWTRMLPPSVVATPGEPSRFWVHVPHGSTVEVWI